VGQQQLEMCGSDSQLIDPHAEQTLKRRLNFRIKILAEIDGHLSAILVDRVEWNLLSFRILLPISPWKASRRSN